MYLTEFANTIRRAASTHTAVALKLKIENEVIVSDYKGRLIDGYFYFFGVEEIVRAYMELNNCTTAAIWWWFKYDDDADYTGSDFDYLEYLRDDVCFPGFNGLLEVGLWDGIRVGRRRKSSDGLIYDGWVVPGGEYLFTFKWGGNDGHYAMLRHLMKDGSVEEEDPGVLVNGYNTYTLLYREDTIKSTLILEGLDACFELYHIKELIAEHFRFRNIFNVLESVSIPGTAECESSVEFEELKQEGKLIRYDEEHKLEFTVHAENLPSFMYDTLLAFCHSRNAQYRVPVLDGYEWRDIIITDYKLPKSSAPDTPIDLELKFCYADKELTNMFFEHL